MPSKGESNGLSLKAYGTIAGIMGSVTFVTTALARTAVRSDIEQAIETHRENPPHVSVREFEMIRAQLDRIEERIR